MNLRKFFEKILPEGKPPKQETPPDFSLDVPLPFASITEAITKMGKAIQDQEKTLRGFPPFLTEPEGEPLFNRYQELLGNETEFVRTHLLAIKERMEAVLESKTGKKWAIELSMNINGCPLDELNNKRYNTNTTTDEHEQ